jgi:hypothetical protein
MREDMAMVFISSHNLLFGTYKPQFRWIIVRHSKVIIDKVNIFKNEKGKEK